MHLEPILQWSSYGTRAGIVRAWRVGLDIGEADMARSQALLSQDEAQRAARLAFPALRRRFIAARAALREVLGMHLQVPPAALAFRYTEAGRPVLADAGDCDFNISHSGDICMIAVGQGHRLGIDVEVTSSQRAWIHEVARSFHAQERGALDALAPASREAAFYRCWVRKEALLKALGVGLTVALDRISVSVEAEARLNWCDPSLTQSEWSLIGLDGAGYAAALAIETGRA